MELIVVPFIVACIVWFVWKIRTKNHASDNARLDEAWRVVLSDPKYTHRRRSEEYNRKVEAQAREAEEQVRKLEGL
jgi:hypothetical protein